MSEHSELSLSEHEAVRQLFERIPFNRELGIELDPIEAVAEAEAIVRGLV